MDVMGKNYADRQRRFLFMKKRFLALACVLGLLTGCGDAVVEEPYIPDTTNQTGTQEAAGTADTGSSSAAADTQKEDSGSSSSDGNIVVGFAQVGAESSWRIANTESMKNTFSEENGYTLLFEDGEQKQENQIKAIRSFIEKKVDYIVLAPATEDGWDDVLKEAKDAEIPVIMVDRMAKVSSEDLYAAWVGSNFELEGKKACAWLKAYADSQNVTELNIVDIQGTMDASAQIGRTAGLNAAVEENGWNLLGAETGNFTQAQGKTVMEGFIDKFGDDINVVYCENDDEAFGAIEALKEAGYQVGTDLAGGEILVMAFDSTNPGLTSALSGEIGCDTECNPLHGSRVEEIIKALEAGQTVEKQQYVDEEIFASPQDITSIDVDGSSYEVTVLTQDVIDGRAY